MSNLTHEQAFNNIQIVVRAAQLTAAEHETLALCLKMFKELIEKNGKTDLQGQK